MAAKGKKNRPVRPMRAAGLFLLIFISGFALAYAYKFYFQPEVTADSVVDSAEDVPVVTGHTESDKIYKARAVIVIDDMGYSVEKVREIIDVSFPVTVAVIPFLPHSKDVAYEAGANGLEVILHMPMEPSNLSENNPGKDALLIAMVDEDIRSRLMRGLQNIPGAVGVNNHMGSRFTEDRGKMSVVISVIKEKGLFFMDSKTSPKSVAYSTAQEAGVRSIERSLFLDNEQDIDYIRGQFDRFAAIALKKKVAVAIGHPYEETLKVLKEKAPLFEEQGIKLVKLSEVLN